jgi:RimJ/RimL family protein N-acetyltransferase
MRKGATTAGWTGAPRRGRPSLAGLRIETARLVLRPPQPGDRDAIVAAIGHWSVARWLARVPHPYAPSDAEAFLARVLPRVEAGRDLPLLVFDAEGLAGCVGLDGLGTTPELGYWLTPSRWGRGYATEAAGAAIALAFDGLGAAQLRSGVFAGNEASMAVQRRLGFEVVGESRVFCLARRRDLDHIDTLLTRERHAGGRQEGRNG